MERITKPARKEVEFRPRALRIGVMGAMASGKSTLANLLGEKWGVVPTEERFQDNPFLSRFYDDPEELGICFKTQISFLGLKAEQMGHVINETQKEIIGPDQLALPQVDILVPPIEMDALYAQVQAEMGLMESNEYDTYLLTYEALKNDAIIPIDLYVLLDASTDVLLERILDVRKREFEHPEFFDNYPDYLPRLANAVRKWQTKTMLESSVVLVDSVNTNFADSSEEGEKIIMQIEDEIKKFLINNPYANENTEIPHGKDGVQLIVPDFLKTR